jgi:hypothetical protein
MLLYKLEFSDDLKLLFQKAIGLKPKPIVLFSGTFVLFSGTYVLFSGTYVLFSRTFVLFPGTFVLFPGTFVLFSGTFVLFSGTFVLFSGTIGFGIFKLESVSRPIRPSTFWLPAFLLSTFSVFLFIILCIESKRQ